MGFQNKWHCITLKIRHTKLSGPQLISSAKYMQENDPIIKTRGNLTRTSQQLTEH